MSYIFKEVGSILIPIAVFIIIIYELLKQKKLASGRAVSHQVFQQQVLEYSQYLVAYGVFLSEFMGPYPRLYVPNPLPPKSPAEFGLRFVSTYIEKGYVFVDRWNSFSPSSTSNSFSPSFTSNTFSPSSTSNTFSAITSTSDSRINPATGLPMVGSLDVSGNPFGTNSHRR